MAPRKVTCTSRKWKEQHARLEAAVLEAARALPNPVGPVAFVEECVLPLIPDYGAHRCKTERRLSVLEVVAGLVERGQLSRQDRMICPL